MEGFFHYGMQMPQDHRSPRPDVVDIAVAIDIEEISPFASFEHDGNVGLFRTIDQLLDAVAAGILEGRHGPI